jgi:hypothetical protein
MSSNPFVEFVQRYRNDPVAFAKDVVGIAPLDHQAEFLRAVADPAIRHVSVRSGHGTGKSTAASMALLWHLLLRYPSKGVVTAPTSAQLFDALFAELKGLVNRLPPMIQSLIEVKSDRIELKASPEQAFISARTSRAENPEALQGIHAPHVLLVADEASAVPDQVFEAAAGSMSGHTATTVLLSNPTRSGGFFFDTQTRLADQWWTRRWSCIDNPLVSAEFVAEMRARYGEDSAAFRVRVLGEFPRADDDTILPYALIEDAMRRSVVPDPGTKPVWGLDVARFGADYTALARRRGMAIIGVERWRGHDTMETVGRVKAAYDAARLVGDDPSEMLVDVVGLGSGVYDRLRELGLPVRGINVSEVPSFGGTYANLRTELLYRLRGLLEARTASLPHDPTLLAELSSIRYTFTSSGKVRALGKEEMKSRHGAASPDMADAVCLTLANEAATMIGAPKADWNVPIRRRLRGIV